MDFNFITSGEATLTDIYNLLLFLGLLWFAFKFLGVLLKLLFGRD